MKSLLLATLAILTASPAHAGPFGLFGRHKSKVVIRQSWRGASVACPCAAPAAVPFARPPAVLPSPQGCPGGVCPAPQAPAKVVPAYGPSFVPVTYQGAESAFLSALNAYRASRGVAPASWDATLAAYAAMNRGTHDPASNPNCWQAWSPLGSLMASLPLWESSGAHAAILVTGTVVGGSVCPSGSTLNVR